MSFLSWLLAAMIYPVAPKTQRYTLHERHSMSVWVLNHMEWPEIQALKQSIIVQDAAAANGKPAKKTVWPNPYRMTEIFGSMPDTPFGDEVPPTAPEQRGPEWCNQRRNRIRAAKRSTEDFMRHAKCDPRPSVAPGRFNAWREEKLVRMLNTIKLGVVLVDGVAMAAVERPAEQRPAMHRVFFDIWEARLMSPQFEADAQALASNPNKPLSNRRIFELLCEREPKLYKGVVGVKMWRDNELVSCCSYVISQWTAAAHVVRAAACEVVAAVAAHMQKHFKPACTSNLFSRATVHCTAPAQVAHCAESVQGKTPLIIPDYYPEDCWPGVDPDAQTFFDLDMYKDSWFIDAGTSDVTKMALNKRGLCFRGGENPPLVCGPSFSVVRMTHSDGQQM